MFDFNKVLGVIISTLWVFYNSNASESRERRFEIPLTKIKYNYYGEISVGTPVNEGDDQVFMVNFDTGSQHLWLIATESCAPSCDEVKYKPYNISKSTTHTADDRSFVLAYRDGTEVRGNLGYDILKLGNEGVRVEFRQVIGFATSVKVPGKTVLDFDGIFGLGLLTESLFPGDPAPSPPMWTMNDQYDTFMFSIYLARVSDGGEAGKVIFGDYDTTLTKEPMNFHTVVKVNNQYQGYKIQLDKIILEKGSFRREILTKNMLALPDSGTNVIVGPKDIFDSIRNEIYEKATFNHKTEGLKSFDCKEDLEDLPSVTFVMNDKSYKMEPREYLLVLSNGKHCSIGIFGKDVTHVILGQTFMQTFYTHFNLADATVGFARANHK